MQISAKSDYAIRAMLLMAGRYPDVARGEFISRSQVLPLKFLEMILRDLRRAELIRSQRGADGGYALARPPGEITLGQVIRAVDGPLAEVRGLRPHETNYVGAAEHLPDVWIALRSAMRLVLDGTTLDHVVSGALADPVQDFLAVPDAWLPR